MHTVGSSNFALASGNGGISIADGKNSLKLLTVEFSRNILYKNIVFVDLLLSTDT